jgi:hypothetical protein
VVPTVPLPALNSCVPKGQHFGYRKALNSCVPVMPSRKSVTSPMHILNNACPGLVGRRKIPVAQVRNTAHIKNLSTVLGRDGSAPTDEEPLAAVLQPTDGCAWRGEEEGEQGVWTGESMASPVLYGPGTRCGLEKRLLFRPNFTGS